MHWHRIVSAVTVGTWLAGCTAPFDIAAPPSEEVAYAQLYPLYAELCAVSQIKKKPGFGVDTSGGPGGHTVFYLNGVCRDRDAGYPTLEICAPGRPEAEQGVGISVNAHFQNANWVATDGHEFFFQGDLRPGERLTQAAYARTQAIAMAKGIYDGIVFHPEVFDAMPRGMDRRDFMYEVSIATDYAIAFARDRYCARVPVTPAQMVKMVQYLNATNAIYRNGKSFEWNVVQNNCTHLAHNALAAAGIWDDWPTDRFIAISAFDFPVPKNEFVNLMRRTNDMDLANVRDIYRDTVARRSLSEYGRMPTEPGGLAEAARAWQENDVYDTAVNLIFYDDPIFGSYEGHFREVFSEPRYTDLRANLRYFAALYRDIKARRGTSFQDATANAAASGDSFASFATQFDRYVDRESATVDAKLDALDRISTAAGSVP